MSSVDTIVQDGSDVVSSGGDAWMKLEKKLREGDDDKVQNYKEDMDNLLVFAGLYSAVLTAFLIESYRNLQEDPQQTMIQLLREISAQTRSYTITSSGLLHTTALPSPAAPFHAAIADVRVNVCWFASLILSLATASYAILVKQWLREYLAIDSTVPEERLRIRHFRSLGLEEWKLFEIAATLPLVLHVSLVLFFVGLCFFTAEVHPSIRTTSVSLVSGWAAFFVFFLLAPVLSPRCPYKTTFLKSVLQHIRPHVIAAGTALARFLKETVKPAFMWISPSLWSVWVSVPSFIRAIPTAATLRSIHQYSWRSDILALGSFVKRSVVVVCTRLSALLLDLSRYVLHFLECVGRCFACPLPCFRRRPASADPGEDVVEISTRDPGTNSQFKEKNIDAQEVVLLTINKYNFPESTTLLEEDDIRRTEDHDLVILKQVDFILMDDNVLGMMRGALERRSPPGEKVLQFVVSAIRYRLGAQFQAVPHSPYTIPGSVSLEALSPNTRASLANILADCILRELTKTTVDDWNSSKMKWMDDTLLLTFALVPRRYPISSPIKSVFQQLLQPNSAGKDPGCVLLATRVVTQASDRPTSHEWQTHVLACLLEPLKALDHSTLRKIVHRGYLAGDSLEVRYKDDTFGAVLKRVQQDAHGQPAGGAVTTMALDTLVVLVEIAGTVLHTDVSATKEGGGKLHEDSFPWSSKELLEFVVDAVHFISRRRPHADLKRPQLLGGIGLDKVFTKFLVTPALIGTMLECLYERSHVLSQFDDWSSKLFHHPLRGAYLVYKLSQKDVEHCLEECTAFFTKLTTRVDLSLVSLLRLCDLVLYFPFSTVQELYEQRRLFCSSVVACIKQVWPDRRTALEQVVSDPEEIKEIRKMARSNLFLIDRDFIDGKGPFRVGRRTNGPPRLTREERDEETNRYRQWAEGFKPEEQSAYPDEFIDVMRCTGVGQRDTFGRTFWRVRILEDKERGRNGAGIGDRRRQVSGVGREARRVGGGWTRRVAVGRAVPDPARSPPHQPEVVSQAGGLSHSRQPSPSSSFSRAAVLLNEPNAH